MHFHSQDFTASGTASSQTIYSAQRPRPLKFTASASASLTTTTQFVVTFQNQNCNRTPPTLRGSRATQHPA